MNRSQNPNSPSIFFQATNHALGSIQGNVLVYLIVLILIFGVLGVTIVSLFTTATSSSATPNNARRAAYVTESAMRYAFSELRNSGFATGVVDSLNTTIYTVDSAGSFTLNIFSPWFVAAETYRFDGSGGTMTLNVPVGKLTPAWMDKDLTDVWVINYDYLENRASARGPAASWATSNDTTLTLTVSGDFNINTGERVCFMVKPKEDQTEIAVNGDLLVVEAARNFFPEYHGVISINRIHYVYEQLVHESADNRVRLKKITAGGIPSVEPPFPLTVTTTEDHGSYVGDFIVLSPRNYIVIPTGTADTVSVAGTLDQAVTIYDSATVKPGGHPDISLDQYDLVNDLNIINRPDRDFIAVNNDDGAKTINIGNNLEGQTDFGGIWFDTDATIGGKSNVCSSAGACEFGGGVRVFFTLDYSGTASGTADGLTFALISAINNTTSSIGGDINAGELLGYAGDSRTVIDPAEPTATTDFLDGTGDGLRPPKLALEFDTWNNNVTQEYCDEDDNYLKGNRNDPFSVEKHRDALQFVFWGRTSLIMPCRNYIIGSEVHNHPTYDDNHHDDDDDEIGDQVPNDKDLYVTSVDVDGNDTVGGEPVTLDSNINWLNGAESAGPWAVRLEVKLISQYGYTLHAWIRQCPDEACEFTDPAYPFYKDTRIQYSVTPHLAQTIELTETEHEDFAEFIFGFTGATGESHSQSAKIADFKLSFIRFNDPEAP